MEEKDELFDRVFYQCKSLAHLSNVSKILNIPVEEAIKLLKEWKKKGWTYEPIPGGFLPVCLVGKPGKLQPFVANPIPVAMELFPPCYIGGWSAVEFWNLTEQIFLTTIVMTQRTNEPAEQLIGNQRFMIKHVPEQRFLGLYEYHDEGIHIQVSDPSKTMVDIFNDFSIGGGLRSSTDFFAEYLESEEHLNFDKLYQYAELLNKSEVFKRLGFLTEKFTPQHIDFISKCQSKIGSEISSLCGSAKSNILVEKWKLRVPDFYLGGRFDY